MGRVEVFFAFEMGILSAGLAKEKSSVIDKPVSAHLLGGMNQRWTLFQMLARVAHEW